MLLANRCSWIALALLSVAAAAQAQPAPRQPAHTGFAFVLLGEGTDGNPVPMVRTVAEGETSCPELKTSSGATLAAMTPRRRPQTGDFSGVLVCEARYPAGESANVSVGGRKIDLPAVRLDTPRRVLLIGDTGCRRQRWRSHPPDSAPRRQGRR